MINNYSDHVQAVAYKIIKGDTKLEDYQYTYFYYSNRDTLVSRIEHLIENTTYPAPDDIFAGGLPRACGIAQRAYEYDIKKAIKQRILNSIIGRIEEIAEHRLERLQKEGRVYALRLAELYSRNIDLKDTECYTALEILELVADHLMGEYTK